MPEMQLDLEVERLKNLVKSFGWEVKRVDVTDGEVVVSFRKSRTDDVPEEAVGADS